MEIKQDYLDKFKVFHEQTLFPPNWDALKENRCPLCSCLLKFPYNRSVAICRSKKHKKSFIIKLNILDKIKNGSTRTS